MNAKKKLQIRVKKAEDAKKMLMIIKHFQAYSKKLP